MGYTDMKLPVDLKKIQDNLKNYLVDIEKIGTSTVSGTWTHDGKVYDNVKIPIELIFSPETMDGGNGDISVCYSVWYEIHGVNGIMQRMDGILDEGELFDLRIDLSAMDSMRHEESTTFYDLEII